MKIACVNCVNRSVNCHCNCNESNKLMITLKASELHIDTSKSSIKQEMLQEEN